jgi:Icc-related predicted phosphoesterase
LIRLISDVHGATAALRRVAPGDAPLFVLGDLINFVDYRTNEGIVSDVAGKEFVDEMVRLRTAGDFAAAGELWQRHRAGREDEMRTLYSEAISRAYREVCAPLAGVEAYVTFGNVDDPRVLAATLPDSATFVEAGVIPVDGIRVGLVGGGVISINSPGEIEDEVMEARLQSIGPVDVLCTHVPPAVDPLARDVVGGRAKGSPAVLRYLLEHQPRFHYFGDIHQPQAVSWRVGSTRCRNVGYFRATGRVVRHGTD